MMPVPVVSQTSPPQKKIKCHSFQSSGKPFAPDTNRIKNQCQADQDYGKNHFIRHIQVF